MACSEAYIEQLNTAMYNDRFHFQQVNIITPEYEIILWTRRGFKTLGRCTNYRMGESGLGDVIVVGSVLQEAYKL